MVITAVPAPARDATPSIALIDRLARTRSTTVGAVDVYWIPLGAGAHIVRINGILYEAVLAAVQRRERCDLYHSVLSITVPKGHYMVEMTPEPDGSGSARGVVAEGAVGLRAAGRLRLFRYEVRRWRDGVVPDLGYAVGGPMRVVDDVQQAQAIFDLLPFVPTPVWGRDELQAGEMWSCNSITSWALTIAGVDVDAIACPSHGRAPGWDAGITVARRSVNDLGCRPRQVTAGFW